MALINTTTPNLIAGVSQQPDGLRFPSQPVEQINMWSSAVEGLIKRPNTNHIKKLIDGDVGDVFVHTINRSETEQYVVIIGDGWIRVFDANTGTEKTVLTPNGVGYLAADNNPKNSFRAKTLIDYTFIANREIEVAMDSDTSAAKQNYALVFVKQGINAAVYTVKVNGTDYSFTATNTDTDAIATGLASAISTGLGAGWTVSRFNYVIKVKKNDNSSFTCEAINKSTSGNILACFVGSAKAITDLPTIGFDGDIVNITGVADEQGDEYYVMFETDSGGSSGAGLWRETIAPSTKYRIDASTMPFVLVREASGDFSFEEADWGERLVGDEDTNPDPNFVGKTINNLAFSRNRLVILAGEGDTFSEAGSYFNFFRTTITALLDSDPIETEATSDNSSEQYSAVTVSSRFVSWGRNGQFFIGGDPILTPESVVTTQVGSYTNDQSVDSLAVEDKVLYTFKRGEANDGSSNTGVAEFFLDDLTLEKFKNFDITSHIPTYIEGSATGIAVNDNNQVVVIQTTKSKNLLYIYKYYNDATNKRLQTAWFKAVFCEDCEVAGFGFIDHKLIILKQHDDGLYLEYIDTSPSLKDKYSDTVFLLDRRVEESDCTISFDDENNTTTFTVPYTVEDSSRLMVIGRYTSDAPYNYLELLSREDGDVLVGSDGVAISSSVQNGWLVPSVVSTTSNSVTVSGDWSDTPCFVGINYDSSVELSKPLLRQATASGGSVALQNGNYFIRSALLSLGNTRTITVRISHRYSDKEYVSTYNNRNVGVSNNRLSRNSDGIDSYRFWIQAKNTNCKVVIENNSPFQHSVLAIDYEGMYNARSKQT